MWANPHALAINSGSSGLPLFLVFMACGIFRASSRVTMGKDRRGFFPGFGVLLSPLLVFCSLVAFFAIGFRPSSYVASTVSLCILLQDSPENHCTQRPRATHRGFLRTASSLTSRV